MTATRLAARAVERVWGRRALPAWVVPPSESAAPVGEVWHEAPGDAPLLVKHLFTAERLSIQVHPDDAAAHERGLARGKDEAWFILDAAPGATIGLGLTREVSPAQLRAAALDGSIEALIDWRPVRAGQLIYSPGGTIHAIGGGVSLIEIQQNLDLTYRLYDYGRPRELHLDDAVAVASRAPCHNDFVPFDAGDGRRVLAAERAVVVERWSFDGAAEIEGDVLLIPIRAGGRIDGQPLAAGTVWKVTGTARIEGGDGMDLLAAYPGGQFRPGLCRSA
jgi:mannose-6-phosphate isomerase